MHIPRRTGLCRAARGLTLIELILAMAISTLLVLGLIQIVSATTASVLLQENQAQVQERSRLALKTLTGAIQTSGFSPEPWEGKYSVTGLGEDSADNISKSSDRLALHTWTDLNCFNNRNPSQDSMGNSLFYFRESVFDLSTDNHLALLCRYGPSKTELTTQIRRQGLIPGIESFQVLYGQDSNQDGNIDSWVRAGQWSDASHILGVKIGLLVSSDDPVVESKNPVYRILETNVIKTADGRLRKIVQFATAFRGRAG
ncbi:MAG: hypothetical protein GWP58_08950 [Gammaproteobacteria bacterium]|nr:hypothetical protein [Gammaproteobacteria bacterium]